LKELWDFNKSVFAQYQYDSEAVLHACFEFDWECSKLSKILKVPEEMEAIKAFLKENYKMMREVYKYYASISPCNGVFSIGALVF